MYPDIFKTFSEILSGPVAFLASKLLIILYIWLTGAALISSSAVAGNLFLILIMLGWFLNLSMIVAKTFLANFTC